MVEAEEKQEGGTTGFYLVRKCPCNAVSMRHSLFGLNACERERGGGTRSSLCQLGKHAQIELFRATSESLHWYQVELDRVRVQCNRVQFLTLMSVPLQYVTGESI